MSQATSASAAPRLPGHLGATPRLSRWLRIRPDGMVEVTPGKVEIGQGILTALAQIVADELDVGLERVRLLPANTARSPNEAVTAGSLSVQDCGMALRHVCAEARAIYLAVAAERLGVAAGTLEVRDGTIVGPGNLRTSYWELADDALLARDASPGVAAKPVAARQLAGQSVARIDMADKVFGRPRFIHDRAFDGLLYGRVLRPATPGARLLALDATAAERMPGVVAVVRDGSFVGVVAETEQAAVDAVARLRAAAQWSEGFELPDETRLADWLRSRPVETTTVDKREAARPGTAVRTMRRSYTRPFLAHASMAPSCAVARWGEPALEVWTHTQGIFNLRADLAVALSRPLESIVVEHMEGAGVLRPERRRRCRARCRAARPRRARPAGAPAMVARGRDELGAARRRHGHRHRRRSRCGGRDRRLAARGVEQRARVAAGPRQDADAARRIAARPAVRAHDRHQPADLHRRRRRAQLDPALRFSGLGDHQPPRAGDADPHLVAAHARRLRQRVRAGVLPRRAVRRARRGPARLPPAPPRRTRGRGPCWRRLPGAPAGPGAARREGVGYGLAFARYKNASAYCAVVAEVEGAADIRVRRLVAAVDVGEVINPDGVVNQIEGGAIQSTSWTLKEAVRFDRTRILSDTWETYPILRFSRGAAVEVEILARPSEPAMGAGEAAQGPTAAAIANAVFDALGVRVRDLPITRERIIAAMG